MNSIRHSVGSVDLNAENQIDSVCDAFEEAWRSGQRPRIEDYLPETVTSDRSTLLRELVRVEAYYRLRVGEAPQLQEYLVRFPGDVETLNDQGLAEAWNVPAKPAPSPTRTIATYELLEMLGEGSAGCVWKARDRTLDRICAVKLPRNAGMTDAEAAAFLREAQAAAQLDHPNIVTVYGVEHDGRTAYIVSEFIAGMNLKEWLANNQPTFTSAAQLCVKLADALAHAHERGIIHRDLKPANIVLDPAGEPHVTDFGLAKRLSADGTMSGQHILGTPAYMSPEQAAGNSKHVDVRTDVYSLGIILYELLTGRRAFEGEQQAVLRQVLSDAPPPPRQVRKQIPRDLETICLKAIAKDRAHRYASASEFAADLNRFLNSEPVSARKPRPLIRGAGWSRRQFTGLALSAVPLVGYALWAGVGRRREGGFRPVTLETEPVGAEVYFIPLSRFTGEPDPARIIHAGRSPVELELPPGEYLVEAVLDEQRFHEVYRRVADPAEELQGGLAHQYSSISRDGARLELQEIHIPPTNIAQGMARIDGDEEFAIGQLDSTIMPLHYRRVPAYFMDPFEFTFGEYRALKDGRVQARLTPENCPNRHAMPVSFDLALTIAEKVGKRLPDEAEYEFAATSGGTRDFTWFNATDTADREPPAAFGAVDSYPVDRVDFDPAIPIYGLCSNVAEWMINWSVSHASAILNTPSLFRSPADFRIVRGGNSAVIDGSALVNRETRDPRCRYPVWRYRDAPGLGVRFVRSIRPRLTTADFGEVLRHSHEKSHFVQRKHTHD